MKKLLFVSRKAFNDSRTVMLSGALAVFAIMALHIVVYPEYGDLQSMQYPEAMSGLFGEAGSIGLVEGYIAAVGINCLALIAVLAVIIGTGATAGEEGAGTLDLVLAQPVRRWLFLTGKAFGLAAALAVMTLAAFPAFLLGNLRADLSISTVDFFATTATLLPPALIFLSIALLAGATLPSRGAATIVASSAVVLAYFLHAAGSIGPLQTFRNVSPFYWADPSHVLFDGFDWLRSLLLTLFALLLTAIGAYALERRDIAAGKREARPLLARFHLGQRATTPPKLGGPYSKTYGIARKTLADIKWTVFSAGFAAFLFAVLLVLIYPSYRDALKDFQYPDALKGLLGEAGSFASPEGFMAGEFFGFVPLILIAIAVIFGSGATAGEEDAGTLDVLLSQPVNRTILLLQKTIPILAGLSCAAAMGVLGYILGRLFVDMDLSLTRFVAATMSAILLSFVFFALALWAGATLPSRSAAAMFTTAAVVLGYLLNTLSFTIDWLRTPNKFSPFYWADASHTLVSGFDWLRALALIVTFAVLLILAVRSLEGRDIVTGRREWSLRSLLSRKTGPRATSV